MKTISSTNLWWIMQTLDNNSVNKILIENDNFLFESLTINIFKT
jgi:hypothetical protein